MVQRYTEVAYPYGRLDFVCDVLRHVVILQPVTPTDSEETISTKSLAWFPDEFNVRHPLDEGSA